MSRPVKRRRLTEEKQREIKRRKVYLPPDCHCVICWIDMGEMNPRQYCCKTYCPDEVQDEPTYLNQVRASNLKQSSFFDNPTYKPAINEYIEMYGSKEDIVEDEE